MEFTAPLLLIGVLGAAIPLLIHLLLRPRPTRITFPAITFLHRKLAAGAKAHRVRNVWLLVVRGLWIACLSLLLAGPRCRSSPAEAAVVGPTATVLVLDDSWSTQFQESSERSTLDELRTAAARRARVAFSAPPPSVVGLVFTDEARLPEELTSEVGAVNRRLSTPERATPHAKTLREALKRATRMLRSANQTQRRLVIFTDGAAHAWRDVDPAVAGDVAGLAVEVVCAAPHAGNLAFGQVRTLRAVPGEGVGRTLEATVRCDGPATRVTIIASERGRTLASAGPVEISADSSAAIEVPLPPLPRGLHGIRLQLQPADRLAPDQTAYAALEIGPRPRAALIATPALLSDDLSTIILRNLLAPEGLAPADQPLDLEVANPDRVAELLRGKRTVGAEGESNPERAPQLLVLPGPALLPDPARDAVRRTVESGATLLLTPGSTEEFGAWDGLTDSLAAGTPRAPRLPGPLAAAWEHTPLSEIAIPLGGSQLEQTSVRRRLELTSLADGTTVHIRAADGAPLLISHTLGRGRVYWLLTAPDPAWSEFGQRAGNLLAILHALLIEASGTSRVAALTAGQRPDFAAPQIGRTLLVERTDPVEAASAVTISASSPRDAWPTALPGLYSVRAAGSNDAESLYAVNWSSAESDPAPISTEQMARLLGVPEVRRVELSDEEVGGANSGSTAWRIPPQRVVALALILLLALETIMISRNRRGASNEPAAAPAK